MKRKRILWFSITPSLYNDIRDSHNGGGWIESLVRIVRSYDEIDLGNAFMNTHGKNNMPQTKGHVTYYPITIKESLIQRVKKLYTYQLEDKLTIRECLRIIDDFKPDLIQVFGSEWCFGLLKEYTDIPIVIHIQGFWPEYRNCSYPPGFSKIDDLLVKWYKPTSIVRKLMLDRKSKERALREERILRENVFYMGRTEWDKAITRLYNDKSFYFYCSEALRPAFTDEKMKWTYQKAESVTFVTVGGGHTLKGYDLVLKTAQLLKQNTTLKFTWFLCGPTANDMKLFEKMTGIKYMNVSVVPLGKCTSDSVKDHLLTSTLYVHSSYIDNSPNSVCEAQYLGLPVIATNVGGTASLFAADYPADMLVPTNDPYYLADKIKEAVKNEQRLVEMSYSNYKISRERHSDKSIYNSLIKAYISVLEEKMSEK